MSNLREELQGVSYGKLKSKFAELGIPEVWKQGRKKIAMIDEAVEVLSRINETGKEAVEVIEDLNNSLEAEKVSEEKVQDDKFEAAVKKIVSKKEFYTAISAAKKARQYKNVFLQHRGGVKGDEALFNQTAMEEAIKRMF